MTAPVDGWECADCGWSVDAAHLGPGWSLEGARMWHVEKACACPPSWP